MVIFDDEDELEIRVPPFPPLVDFKGKGKEILDETAFEQIMREATDIFKDDNRLLGL